MSAFFGDSHDLESPSWGFPFRLRAWLNYNAMFYQTFICFCLSEAKRLCLNQCSWLLDDVEFETFNLFVTQINRNLFVISFPQMFHKTLRYRLARPLE